MEPIVILGAGLAGLSTAHFLNKPWRLIEKSDRVGGLIKTEVIQGCYFDPTGHWLHLRDPEIQALVNTLWLPDQMVRIQRKAGIFTRGVFTRFPYQVNTHGLPPEVVAENLTGYVEAVYGEKGRALREREPTNFEEFILRYMGEGFAKNFMVPYNQKLWTVHPREMSAAWVGRFVPRPNLKEVVDGALGAGSDAVGYNASFLYPREGGIESLARAMLSHLEGGQLSTHTEPTSVDWKARKVTLSDGSVQPYAGLVSSISLPGLVKLLAQGASGVPDSVQAAAKQLRATTVTYVAVGAKGANRQPWHWIYLPEPEFHTYRIGSPSAVYAPLAPPDTSTFYVEYSHHGELSPAAAEKYAVEDLVRSQMIHSADDILFAQAREIPHAYVLYDEAYGPAKAEILRFLEHAGIQIAGRYGQWEYSSMEDAILAGRACARTLNG
ncbi:FAD-dependent oxidoreductase [Comamonas sp. JC664]|uniref:protoporphyrinogen/coproporphyrinogen oxidase n=1 Tax=Comamonas sp. JC664 TaxID=2801917 RepID=UPI00174B9D27|nr:FAD-dependent oxidoreductase [Comamonas sp. JC664]MBL0692745.1 FAD-dependent oxidoreductase [Comamonas sp. JC664]GHG93614.1 O-antigen synthesis protein WbyH [Comamonas sp. KCTC 72670]